MNVSRPVFEEIGFGGFNAPLSYLEVQRVQVIETRNYPVSCLADFGFRSELGSLTHRHRQAKSASTPKWIMLNLRVLLDTGNELMMISSNRVALARQIRFVCASLASQSARKTSISGRGSVSVTKDSRTYLDIV